MKKLLLSLGALSAVVAPVAAVVACGSTDETHGNADKAIAAQRAKITASKASQTLKDAALAELAKVKDAKGLVVFYATAAFKAYTKAANTAPVVAPVVAAGIETGDYVEHAFKDHATFANLAGITVDTAIVTAVKALGTATSTLTELQANIATFNAADNKIAANAVARTGEQDLIDSLAGKSLKAELFYQQDDKAGMTFVGTGTLDAATFKEAATAKLDTANAGHRNSLHNYGIRFVTVEA